MNLRDARVGERRASMSAVGHDDSPGGANTGGEFIAEVFETPDDAGSD